MRTIDLTSRFRKDYRRVGSQPLWRRISHDFDDVVAKLQEDLPLEERHRDHALVGEWADHRDCHIRPDLVLIYRKLGDDVLQLVRLGSHSELEL